MKNSENLNQFFQKIALDEQETGGALVVYHKNKCIVNQSVGKATANSDWTTDTLSLNFSTGKGVLATLVHCLVSQNLLDYDTPICQYWAEFAVNGKEKITLRQVMSHQADLFAIDSIIDNSEQMLDWQFMLDKVANMSPTPIKHTAKVHFSTAYSALVYGWILGGLITKVTNLSLQQALDKYLAEPLNIQGEVYFTLPQNKLAEVAQPQRNFYPKNNDNNKRIRQKPLLQADSQETLQIYQSLNCYKKWQELYYQQTGKQKEFLTTADINSLYFQPNLLNLANYKSALMPNAKQKFDYYQAEVLQATIPAVNCIASANALAKIYNMLAQQGAELIHEKTWQQLTKVHNLGADAIMPAISPHSMLWRLGYHRVFSVCHNVENGFGHMGYNGSMAWCDPSRQLTVTFIHNFNSIMLNDVRGLAINELILEFV
ncbi:MAG: beta-lactamase family protein [Moraxellaceae bacterium]|nr:beta-lactamase family protein [Moraxellaceae bacterium]